ncbi:glycosyltransferase family 39 protein [candidate division KSB1 bacterium]|nr:glycosyltransferase family 39 protein [candidate division KSB1 bacterium]
MAKHISSRRLLLLFILFAGLAVRVVLLQFRWINPDEGAHLLDARLWLDGQAPVADFGSRQPFYVVILALFLNIFGMTLSAARLMPVAASLGITLLLYLMGKRWFGTAVGLTAALIYSLLPLVVIWSTIVKTEQLTILLATASMLLLLLGMEKRSLYLFISGLLAALAFYVRQPALYLPMAAILFLLLSRHGAVKNIALYLFGYLSITVITILLYLRHMNVHEILFSQLNPLNLIWNRALHMLGRLPQQYSIVDDAGFRILDQDMSYTLDSWYHALAFSFFIVIGALFARRYQRGTPQRRVIRLLFCWFGFSALLYLYQSASRGFYTQYFTEFLPPLLLMASVFIVDILRHSRATYVLLPLATAAFTAIFIVQRLFWQVSPGMVGYLVLSIGAALLLYFCSHRPRLSVATIILLMLVSAGASTMSALLLKRLGLPDLYRFILVTAILSGTLYGANLIRGKQVRPSRILFLVAFFYAAFYSGRLIGLRYEAIWSPATLDEVAGYLRANAQPPDDILSGGAIWTFESGLAPYLNVPHATEFYKHHYADFESAFQENPPRFIIMDGYTERKFMRYKEFILGQLALRYEKVLSVDGSKYTVDVFQVRPHTGEEKEFTSEVVDE